VNKRYQKPRHSLYHLEMSVDDGKAIKRWLIYWIEIHISPKSYGMSLLSTSNHFLNSKNPCISWVT